MDDFQDLKFSAFSKARLLSFGKQNITLGPEAKTRQNIVVDTDKVEQKMKEETKTANFKTTCGGNLKPSPLRRLLVDLEYLRIQRVQEAVLERQMKMLEFHKEQENQKRCEWYKQQQRMIANVQEQEYQICLALEEHKRCSLIENEKLVEHYKEMAEKRRKNDEELQQKEQRKKELIHTIECLQKDNTSFYKVHEEIKNITRSFATSQYIKDNLPEISNYLIHLCNIVDTIKANCTSGNICHNDKELSSECLEKIYLFKSNIEEEIMLEKQKEAQQKEIEEEQVQLDNVNCMIGQTAIHSSSTISVESDIKKGSANDNKSEIKNSTINFDKFVSKKSLRFYCELQDFQEKFEKSYEELIKDQMLKQYKFDLKKAINTPVNAISSISAQHLTDKFNRLSQLLLGQNVQVGDKYLTASSHPQGIPFCMDLLAKKFILQCDLMVSGKPDSAFYFATIIVSLWNTFPDFGKLLLAHFHKQCPYLVPIYLPKAVDQSDQEYYKSLGYKYDEEGVIEKQDKFLKRMTGIMRLYSAIFTTKPKMSQNKHPHGLAMAWQWLAAFLNLEPRIDITATMLHVFLETGGYQMQGAFGNEFKKIIEYIQNLFLPELVRIDTGGPVTRLQVLLQEYSKKGQFDVPKGILPSQFW